MNHKTFHSTINTLTVSVMLALSSTSTILMAEQAKPDATPVKDSLCPNFGWSEGLAAYLKPDAQLPTQEPKVDCDFHEWSWEAFVWATALDTNGVPRFMTLSAPSDLQGAALALKPGAVRPLKLGLRSLKPHASSAKPEVAGAIVEADGNMMVAPNGYPVLASVHMNNLYFETAQNNLIIDNGYQNNADKDSYFNVGSAIFKATWLRLDDKQQAPAGAFTTQAEVPWLVVDQKTKMVAPSLTHKPVSATVALVGLHVVGITDNHPEFLWATFEHKLNAPMLPDNTFKTTGSDKNSYTFYTQSTPYNNVNMANQGPPAVLTFDENTQKFSPITNAVQENMTGGENNSPQGPANIASLNKSAQGFLSGQKGNENLFANYNLIGTLWMQPNTYVTLNKNWPNLNEANGVGSVNLANSTAETFQQVATNTVTPSNLGNCFGCHNPQSYAQDSQGPAKLKPRRIGISHVLSINTPYGVANQILVK
jgi:hypothetical protein